MILVADINELEQDRADLSCVILGGVVTVFDWLRYLALAEQIAAAIQQAKAQGKPGVFQIILKPATSPPTPDEIPIATLTI